MSPVESRTTICRKNNNWQVCFRNSKHAEWD
jgi:hypothetical protein